MATGDVTPDDAAVVRAALETESETQWRARHPDESETGPRYSVDLGVTAMASAAHATAPI